MINSISMFKTAKQYSPAFEAKGKINYEYKRVSADSFDRFSDELKDYPDLQKEVKKAQAELFANLIASGKLVLEGKTFLLKDKITKVTVEQGDDEIPDDINAPDAEIEVKGVELNTIIGKELFLRGEAKVGNVAVENLIMEDSAEVTGSADVSQRMKMSYNSKANNVKANDVVIGRQSRITGTADVSGEISIFKDAKANNVNAAELRLMDSAEVTGSADVSKMMIMNNNSKANNVKAENLILLGSSEITGLADVSRKMVMREKSKARAVNVKYLELWGNAEVTGLLNSESTLYNRVRRSTIIN